MDFWPTLVAALVCLVIMQSLQILAPKLQGAAWLSRREAARVRMLGVGNPVAHENYIVFFFWPFRRFLGGFWGAMLVLERTPQVAMKMGLSRINVLYTGRITFAAVEILV